MAEENQTNKEETSKEELQKIAEEIKSKEAATVDSIKRDVTANVKKELEDEAKLKMVAEENAKLKEQVEESAKVFEEKLSKTEEAFKQQLEDIKNMKQSVATNDNPFKSQPGDESNPNTNKLGVDITKPEVLDDIEEESRRQFIEKMDVSPEFGQRQ